MIGTRVHERVALAFLAAVIGASGAAAADPVTSPNSPGIICETAWVPMRDGTLLATDVYLPAEPGRHPVIMQRTPYGFRLGHGCFVGISAGMAYWAQHGYVALTQDSRGTFRSQGTFTPIFEEQDDGYDAVEWAAVQPWSNGRVGMTGASYFGLTQWQAALTTPPHLYAIAPNVTATDYHDHWTYVNGAFDLWFAQSWLVNFFASDQYWRQLVAKGVPAAEARQASDRWLADAKQKIFTSWVWELPLEAFPEFRELAPYYYEWLAHPNYDAYWAKIDVEQHFDDIAVPALVMGGWYDLFEIGSVRSFQGVRENGASQPARLGTKLVMQGGGVHGYTGAINWGAANVIDLQAMQLRFYDHYLRGIDNGIDREPAVRLFVQVPPDAGMQGGGFWVSGETFPLPGTRKLRFDLRSGGQANTRLGDGVLVAARGHDDENDDDDGEQTGSPGSISDRFVYDPRNPVPTLGGGLCCNSFGIYFNSGARDQSDLELRNDVLVYTSAALTQDIAVIGQGKVKFWAKTTALDTDFTAKLVDVHPDGFAQNVLDRIVRAQLRHGSKSRPSPIRPGKAYEYEIDLGYTGSLFKAGHRIRVDISSSNFPHFARNQNTADPASSRIDVAEQTILHGAGHQAYLELSVVPGVKAP